MPNDPNLPLPLVFDIAAAAQQIGASERWLADQARARRFPGRKVSRRWYFTREDLDEILRLCAVGPTFATSAGGERTAPQGSSMTRTTARRVRRGEC
ncbi:helix-turn-helix domain-containing protein [Mycobacterium gordonae]|uniref:helix-turn-helix domain-containing protein n=1 Tax=Mycobacterium gordonae TaxID=1778 RepID=UPI00114F9BAD|nr:helix-turn-helix domain-containing protein [Mycobacterium gordonae]